MFQRYILTPGDNVAINPALSLFILVSISTAIYIFDAINFRLYLQRYQKKEFFESLKGLISVDFDHPSFPTEDEAEIRRRQKNHDRLFYVCVFCFVICAIYNLAAATF